MLLNAGLLAASGTPEWSALYENFGSKNGILFRLG
jgi:hypothetical protein